MVIDSVMAKTYFPHTNPIGQSITVNLWGDARIIGVAAHVRHSGLGDAAGLFQPQVYGSMEQFPDSRVSAVYGELTTIVRTPLEFSSIMPAIKAVVYSTSSDQRIYEVRTMREILSESMLPQRFPMILLGAFAGLALLLASVGIYGVISYSVAQRVHEIGIRMALGAEKRNIFRMVIGQGLRLALFGLAIGTASALILTRLLSSFSHLLYGVGVNDPLTFTAVSFILAGVAILACYIPARRAAHVDPMVALRND